MSLYIRVDGNKHRLYEWACGVCGAPLIRSATARNLDQLTEMVPRGHEAYAFACWQRDGDCDVSKWYCLRCTDCGGPCEKKKDRVNEWWILARCPKIKIPA